MHNEINFKYTSYDSASELNDQEQNLLQQAKEATKLSYSPYSKFRVGAAAILDDGQIIVGSNQENASFGATICAERVMLATIATIAPQRVIKTVAISYVNANGDDSHPISPCGICRQSLLEYQVQHQCKLRVLMAGSTGKVWAIEDASSLLPLAFSADDLG